MIRFITSFFGGLFSWVVTALFFGALVVGAVFWVYSRDLPDYESLANYTPKTISRIYSGEGKLMDEFATERRIFAPIEDVPDVVKWAFISAEDKNFYTHKGFDARGIIAAAFEAVKSRGKNVRGASTIPQQVAKNFLLSGDRTAERKIKELILSTRLVQALPKDKRGPEQLPARFIELIGQMYKVEADARREIEASLNTLAELGVFDAALIPAMLARVHFAAREAAPAVLAKVDVLFEGVPEKLDAKREAFEFACAHLRPEALLASMAGLASGCSAPLAPLRVGLCGFLPFEGTIRFGAEDLHRMDREHRSSRIGFMPSTNGNLV